MYMYLYNITSLSNNLAYKWLVIASPDIILSQHSKWIGCISIRNEFKFVYTVKPVYNDHLYNKIYYLWFIQLPGKCFNEDWMYQFTLANNFCLLELI